MPKIHKKEIEEVRSVEGFIKERDDGPVFVMTKDTRPKETESFFELPETNHAQQVKSYIEKYKPKFLKQ